MSSKFRFETKFPIYVSGIPSRKDFIKINEFHEKRKRGDYTKIADRTAYDVSYVWRVLNGERGQNERILQEARDLVRKRKSPYDYSLR